MYFSILKKNADNSIFKYSVSHLFYFTGDLRIFDLGTLVINKNYYKARATLKYVNSGIWPRHLLQLTIPDARRENVQPDGRSAVMRWCLRILKYTCN